MSEIDYTKKIIYDILVEEFSKSNDACYRINHQNLVLILKSKRLNKSIVSLCVQVDIGIDSIWRFSYASDKDIFSDANEIWLHSDHIWKKIQSISKLNDYEIASILNKIFEDEFNVKNVILKTSVPGYLNIPMYAGSYT